MEETWVRSLVQEEPLEKKTATHCSIFAWRIPRREEPGGLRSVGLQRVRHNWAIKTTTRAYCYLVSVHMLCDYTWSQSGHLFFFFLFFKVSFSFGKELALFLVQATSSSRISCVCVHVFVQALPGEAVWSPERHRTMSPFRGVYQSPVCTVTWAVGTQDVNIRDWGIMLETVTEPRLCSKALHERIRVQHKKKLAGNPSKLLISRWRRRKHASDKEMLLVYLKAGSLCSCLRSH